MALLFFSILSCFFFSHSHIFVDDFLGQVQISIDELAEEGQYDIRNYTLVGKKENTVDRGSVSRLL